MREHWAASFFLYVLVIHIVWRAFDAVATSCCNAKSGCCYSRLSPFFRMLLIVIALVICISDSVGFCLDFHFYDPHFFLHNYTNGTALGPEWQEQLVFPTWLRWLVVFSPLALLSVTILSLWGLYVSQASEVGTAGNPAWSDEDTVVWKSNFITMSLLHLSGKSQSDKARMVRIMPVIYVFMSYNSIMRMMELFTGDINPSLPRYEYESLAEKSRFVDFMVIGNDNCMALFSACALLNFAAYLLQGIQGHENDLKAMTDGSLVTFQSITNFSREGAQGLRMIVKSVLFQMLKYYIMVNVVQFGFGIFTFFLFREKASHGRGILSYHNLNFADHYLDRYGELMRGAIQGAGIIASMSTWGSLSVLSQFTVSLGRANIDGQYLEVFGMATATDQQEAHETVRLFGLNSLKYNKKFLSIKIMVSLDFLQKTGIRLVASSFGYPKMTHYLIAQVILIYEAVMLAVFMNFAWPEQSWHLRSDRARENAEPLLA